METRISRVLLNFVPAFNFKDFDIKDEAWFSQRGNYTLYLVSEGMFKKASICVIPLSEAIRVVGVMNAPSNEIPFTLDEIKQILREKINNRIL